MFWIKTSSIFMFLGVGIGAFGSHALNGKISPTHLEAYKTGVFYHFIHALGLLFTGLLINETGHPSLHNAAISFTVGIFLFSGSLYAYAVTKIRWLGFVTPLGGLCFMAGWLMIFWII